MMKKYFLVMLMFLSLNAFSQKKFDPNAGQRKFFQHWRQGRCQYQ